MGLRSRVRTLLLAIVAACASPSDGVVDDDIVRVFVSADLETNVRALVGFVPGDQIDVVVDSTPWDSARSARGINVAVVAGESCTECYRIETEGTAYRVSGDAPLGVQYGLTAMLEAMGVRFFSPFSTYVPPSLVEGAQGLEIDDALHEPDIAERGVQLHTLHPIEAYYALWVPSAENLERSKAIVDWLVKCRVDLMTWVPLDDIVADPAVHETWKRHTAQIVNYAHARGLRTGINVQLFGSGNLQKAFDLIDEESPAENMHERFALIFDGIAWDHVTFSFGEFSGESPSAFLSSLNMAHAALQEVAPGTTASSVVHVGNYEDLYVEYEGQTYLYYLLAQFADPAIVPWIHTVMYYNLFDDAGGAYLHDEFTEHRELLLTRLEQGADVGYFPETAYWVAFDNSVPTYLPVYIASRFRDLDEIRRRTADMAHPEGLQRHIVFSSGWEWGYWQNDYAVFRMSYELGDDWRHHVDEMFSPFGQPGLELASIVADLAESQRLALIERRLAAYLAGRDGIIDLGDLGGIVSQPDRIRFSELGDLTQAELGEFLANVMIPLEEHATLLGQLHTEAAALDIPRAGPWHDEVVDGIEVTALRASYVAALYRAALAHIAGGDPAPHLGRADTALASARAVVGRRHAALAYPPRGELNQANENATIYQYGYLEKADTLCYWERERVEVDNLVTGAMAAVPPCFDLSGL